MANRPVPLLPRIPSRAHIVLVAWRDLANPAAGGSEVLIDRLAEGMTRRGHRVTLLAGGPSGEHPYDVVRSGGRHTQFLTAPLVYRRRLMDADVVVEVCNGLPFLTPLWARRPTMCLVNHIHTEMWPIAFPAPVAAAGSFLERRVMPWAHRDNLILTVSDSTAQALRALGVSGDRIRTLSNGVEPPTGPRARRSPEPLFVALGRLTPHKRIDLLLRMWDRVRQIVGGRLVIIGDGPERRRLEAMAGPGVVFTGRVGEQTKHRYLEQAWLLLHPALVEGWGIVVAEAAVRGTPALGFDVPGLRDSVVDGWTGLLARNEGSFTSAWASLALDEDRRRRMGRAARERAIGFSWNEAVSAFAKVVDETMARQRRTLSVPSAARSC